MNWFSLFPSLNLRQRRRLRILVFSFCLLSLSTALLLYALRDNLVFFYTPCTLLEKKIQQGTLIRLGGLVKENSLHPLNPTSISFEVTDRTCTLSVSYTGPLPELFSEGKGVVVEGTLETPTHVQATLLLAKHDERYRAKSPHFDPK